MTGLDCVSDTLAILPLPLGPFHGGSRAPPHPRAAADEDGPQSARCVALAAERPAASGLSPARGQRGASSAGAPRAGEGAPRPAPSPAGSGKRIEVNESASAAAALHLAASSAEAQPTKRSPLALSEACHVRPPVQIAAG
eukprot:scaffold3158_cov389-Prasinococcus_capsulatus_cf.AAC.2